MAKKSASEKPKVFISHIHNEEHTANTVEAVLRKALLGAIDIFNSSNRQSIIPGDPWRDKIVETLQKSTCVLVLASPNSVSSPWVNFEAGGAWVAGTRVIPCCAGGMKPSSLPAPWGHLHGISLDSADGLSSLVRQLAELSGLDFPSDFDFSSAAKSIANTWELPASTLNKNSLSIHLKLAPDLEVADSLKYLNVSLLAVDGMIEIQPSPEYSGWAREDIAPLKVVGQCRLPHEFYDYTGEDVRCETGSQKRYTLRRITPVLLDDGQSGIEQSRMKFEFAESSYADLYRLSRLLERRFIEKEGVMLTGRELYGSSWFPLDGSPLIHNVNAQPIIITHDNFVVLTRRSLKVHHYPGCWSASIEEQMIAHGDSHKADESVFDCAERGVDEELKGTPVKNATRILSVGIEYANMSASFICLVRVEERLEELRRSWPHARDPNEVIALSGLYLEKPSLHRALSNRQYHATGQRDVPADWHPTSRMRLYALMRHIFGAEQNPES
jgi:hypothetical protein